MKTRKPPHPGPRRRDVPRLAAALLLSLLGSACDAGLEGVYANRAGSGSLAFRRDGTVDVTVFGGTYAGTYEVDGARVVVDGPNGVQVYTLADGQLDGGFGIAFVRRPDGAGAGAGAPD